MTDLNKDSIFDPRTTILTELLSASFWEHLADGDMWLEEIKNAIDSSTKEAYENDNTLMQKEIHDLLAIIGKKEAMIKDREAMIDKFAEAMCKVNSLGDELSSIRIYNDRRFY
jgi:hypothetical protein